MSEFFSESVSTEATSTGSQNHPFPASKPGDIPRDILRKFSEHHIGFASLEELKNPAQGNPSERTVLHAEDIAFKTLQLPTIITSTGSSGQQKKTYMCEVEAAVKETPEYANAYFARYFEWQGIVREKWFTECIEPTLPELEGHFITSAARVNYHFEVYPFQKIKAILNTQNISETSFDLEIIFFHGTTLVSTGIQKITYADRLKNELPIPSPVLEKLHQYYVD